MIKYIFFLMFLSSCVHSGGASYNLNPDGSKTYTHKFYFGKKKKTKEKWREMWKKRNIN